jgi:hypothetical protein
MLFPGQSNWFNNHFAFCEINACSIIVWLEISAAFTGVVALKL